MAELIVQIPEDLKNELNSLSKTGLSVAVSKLVKDELVRLSQLKKIASKSKLTQKTADEISREINKSLARRYESL